MKVEPPISRDSRPAALLVGFDPESFEACLRALGGELHLLAADGGDEALAILDEQPVAVLCLGREVSGERAVRLLERAAETPAAGARADVVLAAGPEPLLFQDLVDRDRIFYMTQQPVPSADLVAILRGAAEHWRRSALPGESYESSLARRVLAAVRSVAAHREPGDAARALAEAAEDLAAADRAYALLYDADSETLWSGPPEERRESAAAGLVSFAVRTRLPVRVPRLAADPRFDREADDPRGLGEERFVAVPVVAEGGRVLAVVAAVRRPEQEPFEQEDLDLLLRLAAQAAPVLGRLLPLEEEESRRLSRALRPADGGLFREQALEHHQAGWRDEGDLLRVDPGWMRWTYRLLLGVLASALLFSLLATTREYASGPAVVRLGGRTDLRSTAEGTVSRVAVASGDRVAAGDLLVRFYGAREAAELGRIEREFELQLINRLRSPTDTAAERSLISLGAERELARARLAERELRATASGTVADVWVREGQHIGPGQALLSLSGERGSPSALVFLPGHFRPLLKPGMPLRLELQGYPYAYQRLEVETVGDEVVGPGEARRFLGDEIGDAVPVTGPVVLVTARLPSTTFEADGRTRRMHDGMWGVADVEVRSERVLVTLIPALKALFEAQGPSRGDDG